MIKKNIILILWPLFSCLIFLAFSPHIGESKEEFQSLPAKYKKWLDEEVIYIISPKEKEVFLQLKNDKDRELFIKAFWKQRDPTPQTETNEFKEEHYRRINYANSNFKRGSARPGWKTDRGRIYIILGPPQSISSFEDSSSLYPTIVWFYQGLGSYGLPDAFNIVFFKKLGVGEYSLYSPSFDGPQSLLAHMTMTQTNYSAAYRELLKIAPALARISINLIPGDPYNNDNSSIASDRLLSNISSFSQKKINDEYAEKLLIYKDSVEIEYSTNYLPSGNSVKILSSESGIFFVNYLFELDKLSLVFNGKTYSTRLSVTGTVYDLGGNLVFQHEKNSDLEINPEQFNQLKNQKFIFQDMFPLIEGRYKLSLLLKNEASKEFTSLEKEIEVVEKPSAKFSDLILSFRSEEANSDMKRAFQICQTELYPSSQNYFTNQDSLTVGFQIFELTDTLKQDGTIKFTFFKDEIEHHVLEKSISEYNNSNCIIEQFSLIGFPPDNYKIRVSLLTDNKTEIFSREEYFFISYSESIPRPWVNSAIFSSSEDSAFSYFIGEQYLNKNDLSRAEKYFHNAYQSQPLNIHYAMSYGDALFKLKRYGEIKDVLMPLLENDHYEVLDLLARSFHATGNYEQALVYYNDCISHYGVSYPILTLIGDCYYRLGNNIEALKAWEKSLEIFPNQPKIKKLVESIKK